MDITEYGAVILAYEVTAKVTGLPTWTDLAARRSPLALPIIVFATWLVFHLARAKETP